MKIIKTFVAAISVLFMVGIIPTYAQNETTASETQTGENEKYTFVLNEKEKDYFHETYYNDKMDMVSGFSMGVSVSTSEKNPDSGTVKDVAVNIAVSNPNVIRINNSESGSCNVSCYYEKAGVYSGHTWVEYEIIAPGFSDITLSIGNVKETYRVNCYVDMANIISIKKAAYDSVRITWEKYEYCSGYYIYRRTGTDNGGYKRIKTINKAKSGSAIVNAPWDSECSYIVVPFIRKTDGSILSNSEEQLLYYYEKVYKLKSPEREIASVKKASAKKLKVTWQKDESAVSYTLYRCERENGKYKRLKQIKNMKTTSYQDSVTQGTTYYYKLVYTYPNGKKIETPSLSGILPKSKKDSAKKVKVNVDINDCDGQYNGYYSTSDNVYYYTKENVLHMVSIQSDKLYDYTLNTNLKVRSKKKISLGKYDRFGGFYYGTDGRYYVAVGFNNFKESKTKTVITVRQYNSNWKLRKTCRIKGNASNLFAGIYIPFDAANCRMDMKGNTLYMFTGREMFGIEGVHHQSNISFKINTSNMSYKLANESYCSHSFNQFVKFSGNNLYLADHGDAYPRALMTTIVKDYGTGKSSITAKNVLNIKGLVGANFTGVKLGGMEVGKTNLLLTGISYPQNYKVAGVTGSKFPQTYNVFVTVQNKDTGKNEVKWLTTYHTTNTGVTLSEVRMVKLSDTRFAGLYTSTENNVCTLHYVLIDDNGNKLLERTYKNMSFNASSQPILYQGNIVWATGTATMNGVWSNSSYMCRIPAVLY